MRVVHLVKTAVGATWALEQVKVQKALGLDVHVVLPGDGPMVRRYKDCGIGVSFVELGLSNLLRGGASARRLAGWELESLKADIYHSHFVQTTLAARMLLGRSAEVPRVFQVAGPLHLETFATRMADVWCAGPQDYWVAACELSKHLLLDAGVCASKVTLAYHGVDVSRFANRARGRLRKELGLNDDVPIVGMVAYMYAPKWLLGQVRGIKGHEDLIEAIAALKPPFNNAVGVFVGAGWGEQAHGYEKHVKQYAHRRLGARAIFLGNRQDVFDLYPDMDVAVHPSHSENLGGAVESMMLARPTVCTSVGGFPDIVIPGLTGWLVPAHNPGMLASAITRVLCDPVAAAEVAERGRVLVSRTLDILVQTRKIVSFYKRILGNRWPS